MAARHARRPPRRAAVGRRPSDRAAPRSRRQSAGPDARPRHCGRHLGRGRAVARWAVDRRDAAPRGPLVPGAVARGRAGVRDCPRGRWRHRQRSRLGGRGAAVRRRLDRHAADPPLGAEGAFSLASYVWNSPSLDITGSRQWSLVFVTGSGAVVSEREDVAALGATFETRRWRSFASIRLAAEYKGERFVADPAQPLSSVCIGCTTRDEVGGSATLNLGHLVSAPSAIAPDHGTLATAVVRRRERQGSPRWSNEVLGRLLWYARAPGWGGFAHSVLAVRATAGARAGPLAETFGVGGV